MRETSLGPSALARYGRLELLARLVVEGVTSGLHRSPFKGFSVEFAEHRAYGPGDEVRHIDWRTYGKTDRYYIKEYEEETNLKAFLVLDSSGSMGYGASTISKLEQARRLAASLAYLMIGQRDLVGLVTFERDDAKHVPPGSTAGHFSALCRALEAAQPSGERPLSSVLHDLAGRIRRRGLVIVLSDAFDALGDLKTALRHLRHRHHEVLFLQVVAPEEESFPFRRPVRFRGLEPPGPTLLVDPAAIRARYLERFHAHCAALREACQSMRADYHKVSTADDVATSLLAYLSTRSRKGP